MKRLTVLFLVCSASACAHLPGARDTARPGELWREAHLAMFIEEFARADSLFSLLETAYPQTDAGREAGFYRGSMRLDPRNPHWSSEQAELALRGYLASDTLGVRVHRRPEALTLLELALQLNMAPEERVAALQPGTVVVEAAPRVVVPADQQRSLAEENERLRRQLAERDEQIRRQREELERIRRTLTPRSP